MAGRARSRLCAGSQSCARRPSLSQDVRGAAPKSRAVAGAADDIAAFLFVPAWAVGETAASVAATLCTVHRLDASAHPFAWMLYTEGARRLGFPGAGAPTRGGCSTGRSGVESASTNRPASFARLHVGVYFCFIRVRRHSDGRGGARY